VVNASAVAPRVPTKPINALERVGAHPALDFANTVSWRGRDRELDYLQSYEALLTWLVAAGVVSRKEAGRLRRAAERNERAARAALGRALALREAIFRVGTALARDAAPPADALAHIHLARVDALAHARFARAGRDALGSQQAWAPTWEGAPLDLDRAWWPLATAFAVLLEEARPHPLGICPDCSWIYLDLSRNRSRRWCSSGDCGNRARGRRFRARHPSA
jgi:predicted RNA-binding Zn ribbon-like protein